MRAWVWNQIKKYTIILILKSSIEGIFAFGGINEDRVAQNNLVVLRVGRRPLEWKIPETNGISPPARLNATLEYLEEINLLVLHGGRSDKREPFNDIWMMDLEKFTWLLVKIYDSKPVERSEHCSTIFGNKLIIFGGMGNNSYVRSDIFEISLGMFLINVNKFIKLIIYLY